MAEKTNKKKEEAIGTKIDLRLPVIGKFHIESFDTILDGLNLDILPEDLTDLEKKIGNYLYISEEYKKILDLLFPKASDFQAEKIRSIVYNKCIEEAPLILKIFGIGPSSKNSADTKHKRSAWANLMLDLGEFELDEHSERLKEEISREIKYTYSIPDSKGNNILNACFISSTHIVGEIWDRITKPDTLVVFIDDDEEEEADVSFADRWGLKELGKNGILKNPEPEDGVLTLRESKKNMVWLNPRAKDPNNNKKKLPYNHKNTSQKIINMIQSYLKNNSGALPVLVVDLLIKDDDDINRIKGDNLIKELRNELNTNAFIIAFTGGRSPFVINSAVKAGADIVIMKERGETVKIFESHGNGNFGGLFDLLWALSQNISRWRFLESYKEELKSGKMHYRPVLDRLFFSIEDESPFWRKYLKDWLRDVENIRLKSIFEEKVSHE